MARGKKMARRRFLKAAAAAPLLATATSAGQVLNSPLQGPQKRNILLFIADDCGVDQIQRYVDYYNARGRPIRTQNLGTNPFPRTNTITRLATAGVTFVNAWSSPVCSPTRACVYTGNHSFRHGVYRPGDILPDSIQGAATSTIAQVLRASGYATGLFGKWHLAGESTDCPASATLLSKGAVHFGWNRYAGSLGGGVTDYRNWEKTVESESGLPASRRSCAAETLFATPVNKTDAADWITQQGTNPWLAVVAFNAPHSPWTSRAPADYVSRTSTAKQSYYRSLLENVDIVMGNLLDGMAPAVLDNTTIIFMGDNGTPFYVDDNGTPANTSDDFKVAISDHFAADHSKDTVYEGGIRVPFIVADGNAYRRGVTSPVNIPGRVVSPGRFVEAPINALDLYATCAQIGNASVTTAHDSVSLIPFLASPAAVPQRQFVFAENKNTAGVWDLAVAAHTSVPGMGNKVIKLIVQGYVRATNDGPTKKMYNLTDDPWETRDLYVVGGASLYESQLKSRIIQAFAGFR